jgi:methylglutaconyl-CoA hydratase
MIEGTVSPRGIATITLDRPEQGNRYDPNSLAVLDRLISSYGADPNVRGLVLRANGRHFCVGADVHWHALGSDEEIADVKDLSLVLLNLETCPKPVLGVVQGGCIGGGAALVACCDIVVATPDTFFAIPEVRLGMAASALAPLFTRALGARAFKRYALTGERFEAETALQLGLVHKIAEVASRDEVVEEFIEHLLLGGPRALAATKAIVAELSSPALDEGTLRRLEAGFRSTLTSPEVVEGLQSFIGKRKPNWFPPKAGVEEDR